MRHFSLKNAVLALLLFGSFLVPAYSWWADSNFAVTFVTRVIILSIAAVSLNLIMGYGGMVSFGHTAYLGIGGYTVGILASEGIDSAFVQWPLALLLCALFGLGVGALSLRTRGIYFIMITLAFTQMVYYVASGLNRYGGDDGLTLQIRSVVSGSIDLSNRVVFYYMCLLVLIVSMYASWRLINSRFGLVIQGARSNDRRMNAIGFPTFRYRLVCFVISGVMCGLAGILLVNHADFVSPSATHWTRSGELIVMVMFGGMGSVAGPVIGAAALLVLEEWLPSLIGTVGRLAVGAPVTGAGDYWPLVLGPVLVLVALFARDGIYGLMGKSSHE